MPNGGIRRWRFGKNHTAEQWQRRMKQRGWTDDQIDEAIDAGQIHPASNQVNPPNSATRYVHPTTGRSVVIDDITWEVIHVGGNDYRY